MPNPDLAGNEIVVVTEMGPAYEITPPGGGASGLWPAQDHLERPENAGWVVKIGDVDPASPGNEIVYGTRDSDRIMMSRHNRTDVHGIEVLVTGVNTNFVNSMLDVAIGHVFPASRAAEIFGVDMSGSVYVFEISQQWQGSVLWRDTNALYAVVDCGFASCARRDEVVVAGASGAVTLCSIPLRP